MAQQSSAGELKSAYGKPATRVDGRAKVTGSAQYASDERVANVAYAYLLTSTIARGTIRGFRLDEARAVPGVIEILTHQNVDKLSGPQDGPDGKPTTTTMETDRVWHAGQMIGMVIAETYEGAREAANKIEVDYSVEEPSSTFGSVGVEIAEAEAQAGPPPKKGNAASAFAAAPIKVDARYTTPTQHHNAIELFATTCEWEGDKLTIYEPSQFMWGTKVAVAKLLALQAENVRVVSEYVGGAFGAKGPNMRTVWVAMAARRVKRPVKLVVTRDQGFTVNTYRAETSQHVQLGATPDGKLTSFIHEGEEITSRGSGYNVSGVDGTARMYACPNIATSVKVVHADRNTPGYMRAPPETPYMFGLESAMDELAHALKIDPIELRRTNDTQTDPTNDLPFSSRSLMKCYDEAAARFGWSNRGATGEKRDGDWLVGYGCATACYPSNIAPSAARLSVTPDGKAMISLAAHEIGTGAYTVVAITVARALGIDTQDVTVHLGDSELPPVMIAGGSNNAASTAHAAAKACDDIKAKIVEAAVKANDSAVFGADPSTLTFANKAIKGPGNKSEPFKAAVERVGGRIEVYSEFIPDGMPHDAMAKLYAGKPAFWAGTGRKDVTAFAFGAHLVEVRIHSRTREIRVPRVVSAFASGTIVNPLTAHSQYMGGAIWGLSSALHESTEIDTRMALYMNKNLADYKMPVNADVPSVEIIMVAEDDTRVNALGIKGIGEIGIVGMNAAVANAVFNATGIRVRSLPIRPEMLLVTT